MLSEIVSADFWLGRCDRRIDRPRPDDEYRTERLKCHQNFNQIIIDELANSAGADGFSNGIQTHNESAPMIVIQGFARLLTLLVRFLLCFLCDQILE